MTNCIDHSLIQAPKIIATYRHIMSIRDLPTDVVVLICHEALREDNTKSEINKFKKITLDMIAEKNLKVLPKAIYYSDDIDPAIETDCEIINTFVSSYIKSLSKTQKDTIICDYGIINAIKLYHDFESIGMGSGCEEICESLKNDKYNKYVIDDIISLIINDELGFNYDWRDNDK